MKYFSFCSSIDSCVRASLVAITMAMAFFVVDVVDVDAQIVESMATGSTSGTFRKQAVSRIPFQQMSPAIRQRVADVVNNASLYRQLPVTTIQSDPDMYLFLLRYPEAIIGTWKLMGISEMNARRTAPFRLKATDGSGTTTSAELVYGKPNLNIYYAEGEYDGPMIFRKVTGSCVIMVESNYFRGTDGMVHVTSRMNFFLKIDNLAASIIAKTIHPLVGTTADHNFVETLRFAEKLSQASARNGPGVQQMADRIDGLTPDVRNRFQEMAGVVWQRSQTQPAQSAAIQTGFTETAQQTQSWRQPTQPPNQYERGPAQRQQNPQMSNRQSSQGYQLGDSRVRANRDYIRGR